MKSFIAVSLLTASFVAAANVPLEDDFRGNLNARQANLLAQVVKAHGYRCDSVSAATESSWDDEYTLMCNGYRYHYLIKDVGGRVVVEVK